MRANRFIRWFFNRAYKVKPPEMVQYWKTGDRARAKLTVLKDGAYAMIIEGEKYPLYGFPRGPVLCGPLAKFKHMTKNLVFNEIWRLLEEGKTNAEITDYVRTVIPRLFDELSKNKYDFFPPERMCPAVRELWRAMTEVERKIEDRDTKELLNGIKVALTFFFQEDDAYRFRFQWLSKYGNPKSLLRRLYRLVTGKPYSLKAELETLFNFIGEAEIVPDMKGRMKLIKRILFIFLENEDVMDICEKIAWELDWNKLKLSKADTYYFRGKYFRVDHEVYDY